MGNVFMEINGNGKMEWIMNKRVTELESKGQDRKS